MAVCPECGGELDEEEVCIDCGLDTKEGPEEEGGKEEESWEE